MPHKSTKAERRVLKKALKKAQKKLRKSERRARRRETAIRAEFARERVLYDAMLSTVQVAQTDAVNRARCVLRAAKSKVAAIAAAEAWRAAKPHSRHKGTARGYVLGAIRAAVRKELPGVSCAVADVNRRPVRRVVDYTEATAKRILEAEQPHIQVQGWCRLLKRKCSNKPNDQGYVPLTVQNTSGGTTHTLLHHVVQVAGGASHLVANASLDTSHLCENRRCTVFEHLHSESPVANNRRKNCAAWVDCPTCPVPLVVCRHDPVCIRYHERYANMEALVEASDAAPGHRASREQIKTDR